MGVPKINSKTELLAYKLLPEKYIQTYTKTTILPIYCFLKEVINNYSKNNYIIIYCFLNKGISTYSKISIFSVPTGVINLCGKIQIRKSPHYGGQAM